MRIITAFSALVSIVLVAVATGCAGAEPGFDARFVGEWQVSGAYGWGLEATSTVYRLHPDGAVEVVFHREGDYFSGAAGLFQVGDSGVSCTFGDGWWSEGPTLLLVESHCSDDSTVVAALVFPASDSLNATFPQPILSEPADAAPVWEGPMGMFYRCGHDTETPCDGG